MTSSNEINPQDFKKKENMTQHPLKEPDFISQNKNGRYEIDYVEMQNFLKEKGFYKLELIKGYAIIRIEDNICHFIELHKLKRFVVSNFTSDEKINYLIKSDKTIFDEGKMDYLYPFKKGFNLDTQDTAYIYFQNAVVILTKKSSPALISYSELDKPIWKTQVIQRDFELIDMSELPKCEFYRFALNTSNNLEEKFKSLCSTFGYALHGVPNPSQRKAIVYMDEKVLSFPGEKNGGTGKTFSTQAMDKFKGNTVSIVGSAFSRNNRFAFQQCELTTERVIINETPDDFNFENLFSEITEGIPVEKKHLGIFKLENAKVIITTNNMIKGAGSSFRRRVFTFEFSDHYSDSFTVEDEFGHLFFEQWGNEQWQLFDNFMVYCQQLYLDNGLIEYDRKNVGLRKLQEENPELFDFFEELESGEYSKKNLLMNFQQTYRHASISQKKLTLVFREYCKANKYFLLEKPGAGGANRTFVFRKEAQVDGFKPLKQMVNFQENS